MYTSIVKSFTLKSRMPFQHTKEIMLVSNKKGNYLLSIDFYFKKEQESFSSKLLAKITNKG